MTLDIGELRSNALAGSVVDQAVLGIALLEGITCRQDYAEAFHWLSRASTAGAPRAMVNLGVMYEHGLGVSSDPARARQLYQEGADRGEFFGCIYSARLLASGVGGPTDAPAAVRRYREALSMHVAECEETREAAAYITAHTTKTS